eukprot:gene19485-26147_t
MTPPVYKSPFSSSKCASGQAVRPSAQAMSIPKSQDNGFSKAGYPQFCGLSTSPMDFGTDFGLFCSDAFPAAGHRRSTISSALGPAIEHSGFLSFFSRGHPSEDGQISSPDEESKH